jgi:capsular polysaccharide biosynthesis protein
MPNLQMGQALARTQLSKALRALPSVESLVTSQKDARFVLSPQGHADWQSRVTDYSGVVRSAEGADAAANLPQSWWDSRLRTPELSLALVRGLLHIGDSVLLTAEGKLFEHSFPRYNRASSPGAVVVKSSTGTSFARDITVERSLPGLSFIIGELPRQFGHFLLEVFSRVWAWSLVRAALPGALPRLVAFAKDLAPWQRQFLELSDWAGHELVIVDEATEFDAALVASPAYVLHDAVSLVAAPAFQKIADGAGSSVTEPSRDVYVSRSQWPKLRRLQEEEKVERLFEARGFEIAHPQRLSVLQQVALARSARCLCGPVGSAMYLAAFQSRGASNFLLAPADFALPDDRMLAHLNGSDLAYYFGAGERSGPSRSADWKLDVDGLAAALDRWLKVGRPSQGGQA